MSGAKKDEKGSNVITVQKIWTIVLIVNIVGGIFVGYYFLKNIQPYAAAQHAAVVEIEKLKEWKKGHDCVIDDMKHAIKECPTKTELDPKFENIGDKLDALKDAQNSTNGKINDIHKWIMGQSKSD